MGKLSLNSKLFNSIIFKPFESKNIVFKGPTEITMGNFINAFDIYNVDGNGVVNMYIGNINGSPLITFLSDGSDWLNLITEENVSNYVIPLNAIFQINSTSNALALLNLGGNATNYFQGQASIKKQNLSTLIPFQIGIDVYPNNLYTFKSATTNLLGTVFNPSLFNSPYADIINITPPNGEQQTFFFDGSTWVYGDFVTNANNYVIPNNSLVQIQTNDITSVPVGGGAIIEKYYSGKISLYKKFLPNALQGLALWLKADAGITTSRYTYTSQIILSGATSSILNKTFVASGTPDPNNYYSYSFAENNGYFITYSQDDTPYYNLRYIAQGTGNIIILNSTDGISWSLVYNMPNTITISGITGTHSSANRTYNLYSYDGDNGIFYFPASGSDYFISTGDGSGGSSTNWFLYKVDPNSPNPFLISTGPLKSSAPSGSWTNNLSSGSPSSTYIGVANGTLPTGSVTTSEYGDFFVTAWADQSGNGRTVTLADSPSFTASSINSRPTVDFNGSTQFVDALTPAFVGNNNFSVIWAFKYVGDGTGSDSYSPSVSFLSAEDSDQGAFHYIKNESKFPASYPLFQIQEWTPYDYDSGFTYTDGSNYILEFISNQSSGFYSVFRNATLEGSEAIGTTADSDVIGIRIAGQQDPERYGNIKMAEIVVYNRILTTPERQQVEAYLSNKYAIQIGLNSGLLAYWKLDTTGWLDSSGNGNTLTNVNAVQLVAGKISNGAEFDLSNKLQRTSLSPAFNPSGETGAFTISIWVYPYSFSNYQSFISTNAGGFNIHTDENGGINFNNGLAGDAFALGLQLNQWQHIVCVKSMQSGGMTKIWLNGTNIYNESTIGPENYLPNSETIRLGDWDDGNQKLNGRLDEAGIWNRELSQAEITELYNSGAGKTYPFN